MKPAISFDGLFSRFIASQNAEKRLAKTRVLSTGELKTVWDAFDGDAENGQPGYFWPADGPHIEDVHAILNERGEGEYCAV